MESLAYTHTVAMTKVTYPEANNSESNRAPWPNSLEPAKVQDFDTAALNHYLYGISRRAILPILIASSVLLPTTSYASVRVGDRCDAVGDVQLALAELGYRPGAIDGVFGAATEAAVIRFQTDQGLTPDGIVGPGTADRLRLGDTSDPNDPFLSNNGCGGSATHQVEAIPAAIPVQTYEVIATALNIRSGPGVDFPVVGTLYAGQVVEGSEDAAGWIALAENEWVSATYLARVDIGAASPAETPALPTQLRVVATALNVRSGPGLDYPVVGTLVENGVYPVSGETQNGWIQLAWGDWVSSEYVVWVEATEISVPETDGVFPVPEVIATTARFGEAGDITRMAIVATSGSDLLVRSSPAGEIVDSIPNGSQLTLSGATEGNWAQLTDGNWVSLNWIANV